MYLDAMCMKLGLGSVTLNEHMTVIRLWIDGTGNEIAEAIKSPSKDNVRLRAGHVYVLKSDSRITRGGKDVDSRKSVWPPYKVFKKMGRNISNLVLREVLYDSRNITLDLTCCFLQVSASLN